MTKKDERCILCNGTSLQKLYSISTKTLSALYQKKIGIDVKYLFKNIKSLNYWKCSQCSLHFLTPLIAGDGAFYSQLQQYSWYYQPEKTEFNTAVQYIREGEKVLEIGAGAGAFHAYLPKNVEYTGLEINAKAAQTAQKQGINIVLETAEEHAKKHAEQYDVICAFQLFEHIPNLHSLFSACETLLRASGKLIIAVPSYDSFIGYAINSPLNFPPHHISHWPDETFQKITHYFQFKLHALVPIPLEAIHYLWFTKVFIYQAFRKKQERPKLIDTRITTFFLSKLSGLLARFLYKGLTPYFLPRGHTIVAILEKK